MQVIVKYNFETGKEEIIALAHTKQKAQEYISKKTSDKRHNTKEVYLVQQVKVYK